MSNSNESFDRDAWAQIKQQSIAQLILKLARRLDEEAISRTRKREGISLLSPAHTRLLPHVELEGTRITELADRLGVTKQAVSQLVDDMEDMGTLERVPDPSDGRAKLVKFSDPSSLISGLEILNEVGRIAFADTDRRERDLLRKLLKRAIERLDAASPDDP